LTVGVMKRSAAADMQQKKAPAARTAAATLQKRSQPLANIV